MAVAAHRGRDRSLFEIPFHSIRNITSPEDAKAGRKVYAGTAPASGIVHVPNDENVRDYIVDAPNKKRRTLTAVHRAMFETLSDAPDSFCVRNGGVVIVARDVEIDEAKKVARLLKPSLINGAQTQGVTIDYLAEKASKNEEPYPFSLKFEILVSDDDELIGEVSISRNSQNNVDPLSIAGKRGVLADLEASMAAANPHWTIRTSETEGGAEVIDTPKLLQVAMAMVPPSIWPVKKDAENPNKVFTYSMRAKCLKDFEKYFNDAEDSTRKDHESSKLVYDFIVNFAPRAWAIYQKWKTHDGFIGTHIQQGVVRDDSKRKVVDVADGILFPVLAALAVFVQRYENGWALVPTPGFSDKMLLDVVKQALNSPSVKGNPWNMGKSRDAYTLLFNTTSGAQKMYLELSRTMRAVAGGAGK